MNSFISILSTIQIKEKVDQIRFPLSIHAETCLRPSLFIEFIIDSVHNVQRFFFLSYYCMSIAEYRTKMLCDACINFVNINLSILQSYSKFTTQQKFYKHTAYFHNFHVSENLMLNLLLIFSQQIPIAYLDDSPWYYLFFI